MQEFNATGRSAQLLRVDPPKADLRRPRQRGQATFGAFVLTIVVLPTALAAFYLFALAANRYEAEARFVVRASSAGMPGQLSSLLQGGSASRSTDDSYAVLAYVTSHDAVSSLIEEADLLTVVGRPWTDPLWHYPGWFASHTEVRLGKHLKRLVSVNFDVSTGISTLQVQAFTPQDAKMIAERLLQNAELLINRLSERAQRDAVALAAQEVELSRKSTIAAQTKITEFRNNNTIVDPGKFSDALQQSIGRLALERAQTNAQIAELRRSSPQSAQIDALQARVVSLEDQIIKERAGLAGRENSLAPLIAEFDILSLEREFAERNFGSSLTAFEIARAEASRQRLFLERISGPNLPDYAAYPYRLLTLGSVLLVAWLASLLVRRVVQDLISHDSP